MNGQILVFTGDGKGKTSAALGTVIRALGNGWKVGWVAFYKEAEWKLSEAEFFAHLSPAMKNQLTFILGGKGFYIAKQPQKMSTRVKVAPVNDQYVVDNNEPKEHQHAANNVLQTVIQMMDSHQYQVIVLDEVCNALNDQLINLKDVLSIVQKRGSTHLILTGRNCPKPLEEVADMVTEMKKIKHPFDTGKNAIKGLDF